jgi:type IV pilus assembly protein PilQ
MRRVYTLAATAAAVLSIGAGSAAAASVEHHGAPSVTALSILPAGGRADVVIAIEGAVEVVDFTLDNPRRVVVDLRGATLGMPARLYDKISRAGITNLRVAQYKPDVVRVVLDLDGPREYTVVRGDHDVRISVNGADSFAAWHAGDAAQGHVTDVAIGGTSVVPAAAAPAAAAPATDPRPEPASARPAARARAAEPVATEPRITVSWQDVHIRDVIGAFAAFSGRTIIIGKSVDGFVTADIVDKPWDIAMKSILSSQGLAALEDSTGIITVDSYANLADRSKVEPLVTQVIAVNYAKAQTMAETIRSLLGAGCGGAAGGGGAGGAAAAQQASCSARGSVGFDEKTNTLLVTETATRLADIVSYIRDLDVRTPQVSIKAKIIAVDRTGTENLGISYDLGSANGFSNALITRFTDANQTQPVAGDFRVNLGGDAFVGVANATRQYKAGSALSLIYNMTLGGFNLTSFLDALSQENLTDVQAEPSTTTVDNKEAQLFAGSQISFLLTPPIIPGQIQSVAPQLQRQEIGITLKVTPHVTANRQVLLDVFAEQQTLVSITIAGPNVNKRNSTNQVLVGDGETAVIGGLTQTQVSKDRSGIPFLMNLPGIGKLFSQTQTVERKQDLLILITPHIVDEGEVVRASKP